MSVRTASSAALREGRAAVLAPSGAALAPAAAFDRRLWLTGLSIFCSALDIHPISRHLRRGCPSPTIASGQAHVRGNPPLVQVTSKNPARHWNSKAPTWFLRGTLLEPADDAQTLVVPKDAADRCVDSRPWMDPWQPNVRTFEAAIRYGRAARRRVWLSRSSLGTSRRMYW